MREGEYRRRLKNILSRYKYVLLVFAVGAALLSWPVRSEEKTKTEPEPQTVRQDDAPEGVEAKLENLLSMIEGVGDVKVMLTLSSGPESIYADEKTLSTDAGGESSGAKTQSQSAYVVLRDSGGNESLVELKKLYSRYRGALIVCRGAANPSVRLAVVEAVKAVTGLGTDCITVAKMR